MGDYVLESNPALGRLIERLAEQSGPPAHEQSSILHHSKRNRRRRRAKDSKRIRGDPMTVGEKKPAKGKRVVDPADLADELVGKDELWANHESPLDADEMLLVDFDEEAEVFVEELGHDEGDANEGDEPDEILDLYGPEDLDEYGEFACVENEEGVWIIDAFKAWMLDASKRPAG